MKWSTTVLILMLFIWLLVCGKSQELSFTPENQLSNGQAADPRFGNSKIHQYTPHDPIIITRNSDFASQGYPGSGTIDDPYWIKGFNITSPDGDLIAISDTTAYFCIANNYLNGLSTAWGGIVLNNVINGIIEDNLVLNHEYLGIVTYSSSNIVIVNNIAFNNGLNGIRLEMESNNNLLENNTVLDNKADGIWMGISCNYNRIINNTVYANIGIGIYFGLEDFSYTGCSDSFIFRNFIYNNSYGIKFESSDNNIIIGNKISNNTHHAIYLDATSDSNRIAINNFFNNNLGEQSQAYDDGAANVIFANHWDDWITPDDDGDGIVDAPYNISGLSTTQDGFAHVSAIIPHSDISIDGDAMFHATAAAENWPGNGTLSNPYIIERLIMIDIRNRTLIEIANTSIHFQIRDSLPWGGSIVFSKVSHGIIHNNTMVRSGIAIYSSRNCTVSDNLVTGDSGDGIHLLNSNHTSILSNQVFNNQGQGISIDTSWDSTISGNTVNNNNEDGIRFKDSTAIIISNNTVSQNGVGIYLGSSNNSTISNNIVTDNKHNGIFLEDSSNSAISNNTITGSPWSGIRLLNSSESTLGNNSITECSDGISVDESETLTLTNNMVTSNSADGIDLFYSGNSILSGNMVSNNGGNGFNIFDSETSVLTANTASNNNDLGIFLRDSTDITLSNNTIKSNSGGIFLWYSGNNTLVSNTITNNGNIGIILATSKNNTILDNILVNNDLFIGHAEINWDMHVTSPTLTDYFQADVMNNSINGKPLVYWQHAAGGTIPAGAAQVILVNCTAVTVANQDLSNVLFGLQTISSSCVSILNNVIVNTSISGIYLLDSINSTIADNKITHNYGLGIFLQDSNSSAISNNTVTNNRHNGIFLEDSNNSNSSKNVVTDNDGHGFYLGNSKNCMISSNIISYNRGKGVEVNDSTNIIISSNTISSNDNGIHLENSCNSVISDNTINYNEEDGILFRASENSTISNNTVSNNMKGIILGASGNCVIYNNTITDHDFQGIEIHRSTAITISNNIVSNNDNNGIILENSSNSVISDNTINYNSGNGIVFWYDEILISKNNLISHNTVSNNSGYGIFIGGSSKFCNVSWNIFNGNNREGTSQAKDDGRNNTFEHNYWDDWTEPDTDGDGVVDTPYDIDGDAENQDMYPRVSPNPVSTPFLSENILMGLVFLVLILPVLGILIRKQKRNF
ncbi:MAG: NosD domain-containing protein [Promethearchaeota archaeon]